MRLTTMNKLFTFQYTNGQEEYEAEYPTREEAEIGLKELKDYGFEVSNINEIRI